jgi:hypothetical protein
LEYHQLTGRRLFLMRPTDLLARASVLDVQVDQASSADAERIALIEAVPPTPTDVARWMCDELNRTGRLRQAKAAEEIEREFGPSFIYINENGNPAIDKDVLRKFRELTEGYVIWDRSTFEWRHRQPDDAPSRQQDHSSAPRLIWPDATSPS